MLEKIKKNLLGNKILKNYGIYIFLVLISLTPLLWYRGHQDELINGLDTNFPLNPVVWFTRRLFLWNDSLNGGIHMNSSVAGLFFHFLQYAPYSIGLSLQLTQKLTFVFWFGMTTFASFIFSKTFLTKKSVLQALFVLLYVFNIYLFNTWENSKVANLALVVGLPLMLSFLELFRQKKLSLLTLSALQIIVGIVSAGAGINPAYFAAMMGGTILYFVVFLLNSGRKRFLLGTLVTFTAITVASSFWIIPLLDFMFFSSKVSSLEAIGFTNWVASLSQNTSLVNIFRIMGAWDWYIKDNANIPIYIPYAIKYFNSSPFILMSFLVPFLAFASLLQKNETKNVEKLLFLVYIIIGVFLGAGLHDPTGGVFFILLDKLPFFSFFRSPWYIFTPYTIIGIGGLCVFFFESIYSKLPKLLFTSIVLVILGGYFLYSYPLWTGKIFRPGRDDGFYVKTPQYVFDFAEWFGKSNYNRVISYPDDQLEKFSWGYKGTDSFLGLLLNKEVYAPSFNYPSKYIESYLQTFYLRLKEGFTSSAVSMLPSIGVDSLLLKKDAQSLSPDVSSNFSKYKATTFGPWQLVDVGSNSIVSEAQNIYTAIPDPKMFSYISPYLPSNSVIIDVNDSQISKFSKYKAPLHLFEAKQFVDENQIVYKFQIPESADYSLVFENIHQLDKNAALTLDGKRLNVSEQKDDASIVNMSLSKGAHEVVVPYPTDVTSIPDIYQKEITLTQSEKQELKDKRTTIPAENFNPFLSYDISFETKYFYGDLPQVEIIQSYEKAPLKVETIKLTKSQEWIPVHFQFVPVPLSSKLEIITKVPTGPNVSITKFQIQNLKIQRIISNRLFVYEKPSQVSIPSKISSKKNSSVEYDVNIEGSNAGYFLLFKENYQNGWNLSSDSFEAANTTHMQANGMYNLWYIPEGGKSQQLKINFEPQSSYKIALLISILAIIFAVIVFAKGIFNKYGKQ